MPDREKVIKGLESLRDICNAKSNMAVGKGKIAWAGYANTADNALNLLKEQVPVKPISRFNKLLNETIYWCGKCEAHIEKNQSYCGCCGQAIKWEEEKTDGNHEND